jgi:hypothetical protein
MTYKEGPFTSSQLTQKLDPNSTNTKEFKLFGHKMFSPKNLPPPRACAPPPGAPHQLAAAPVHGAAPGKKLEN